MHANTYYQNTSTSTQNVFFEDILTEEDTPEVGFASRPRLTIIGNANGLMTKSIEKTADGINITAVAALSLGRYTTTSFGCMQDFADLLDALEPRHAIMTGTPADGVPEEGDVVSTASKLNGNTVTRTQKNFVHHREPTFIPFDKDTKGASKLPEKSYWEMLVELAPKLEDAAHLVRTSTSSGLWDTETNTRVPGSCGEHAWIVGDDGTDTRRFLHSMHERAWLHGWGWIIITKAGTMLERSIIDVAVDGPERLVFEANPVLGKGLRQEPRTSLVGEGEIVNTLEASPPLTAAERAEYQRLVRAEKDRRQPEADKVHEAWIEDGAERLVRTHNISKSQARHEMEQQTKGVLLPHIVLEWDREDLHGCTVGDVLANPERFAGATLADPNEGIAYGRCKAKVLYNPRNKSLRIKSFAHGGVTYLLRHEEAQEEGISQRTSEPTCPNTNISLPRLVRCGRRRASTLVSLPCPHSAPTASPWSIRRGDQVYISATTWLDQNRPVEQMTWAPGFPMIVEDRLISNGGWIERKGVSCFNLYRPPTIKSGNYNDARPWLDHIYKIYPHDADHIIKWFAWRVQRPDHKINHALVLGSNDQGIGKDTMIEPVKRAVGPWNFEEVSPQMMMGRFNGFLKSVILRVNEAHDLGDFNRYQFYDHMKAYTAAPPDVLRVDEKYLPEHSVLNCVGVVITTNHKTDGIYLPSEDRRHYVAWSQATKGDFTAHYWNDLWGWMNGGGDCSVVAYLLALDISSFDPKAPPPKTAAFWEIVDANRAPEDAELADVLDHMENPDALTLADITLSAHNGTLNLDLYDWLKDRKNRRVIPHRLEKCGYVPVRNDADTHDGQWKVAERRQTIYAKKALSLRDQLRAARALIKQKSR